MAFNCSVSPISTADGDNLSDVPLLSNLQLNDRRRSEGETLLRDGCSTSKLAETGTTIDDLPDELMLEIFSHIGFSENINVLQKVSTRWKILAQDAHLWRNKMYIVRHNTSEEEAIATFAAAPQLRTVIMDREVSPGFFEALSRYCPHLTTLETHAEQILNYSEADDLFDRCKKIHTLTVSDRGLWADARFTDAVARLADLRVLHLEEYEYWQTEIPLHALADACPHLCDLELGKFPGICYRIRDAEYFLSSHKHLLKSLSIKWTSVEGKGGGLPKLQQLQLGCIVADETTRAVAKHCPELRGLALCDCEGHTDALFEPLQQLEKLKTLKVIGCRCLCGKALPHIAKLPALKTLYFDYIQFDESKHSLDSILEISGLRQLTFKFCYGWAIPFDNFPGRLVNLRELNIQYCSLDRHVVDEIRKQMPNLRVKF